MKNLIPELLSDSDFEKVAKFINNKALRNYLMKQNFKQKRNQGLSYCEAIKEIKSDFPELNPSWIRL